MDVLDGKLAVLRRELEATGVSPSLAEHELSDARALAALDLEGFRSGSMNALLGGQAP